MTDTKRRRGGQWLYDGIEPRKYSFKAHPELKDRLAVIQADLEAHGIEVSSQSSILRALIDAQIDNAVQIISKYVDERNTDGCAS